MKFQHELMVVSWLAVFLFLEANVFGQLTQLEIYQLDPIVAEKSSNSRRNVSHYFIQMGLRQQKELKLYEQRGQLDDLSRQRLDLLNEALRPINEFEANMLNPNLSSDVDPRELFFDLKIGDQAFNAIGEDEAVRLAAERGFENVKIAAENARETAYSPIKFASNKVVSKLLKLSDDQIQEIERLTKATKDKLRVGSQPEFEELGRLLESHWELLLFELDTEQKSKAKELIGLPVQWFRNAGSQNLRSIEFGSGTYNVISGSSRPVKTEDGRSIFEMTYEELNRYQVKFASAVESRMLDSPFVWDELELTKEQRRDLKATLKSIEYASSRFDETRLGELLDSEADIPNFVKGVLIEEQCTLFLQMELQIYTAKFWPSVGLLHPRMTKTLSISADQIRRIEQLSREFEQKTNDLVQIIEQERNQIQSDFTLSVREVLTKDQRMTFDKFTRGFSSN